LAISERSKDLVSRRGERIRLRRAARRIGNLAEREVLREAARREIVDRTAQEREVGAAGRMRTARATIEVDGHTGAAERVLEKRGVLLRRPYRDGHAIERHAAAGLAQNGTRDLDPLAPLSRRRG